MTGRDLSLYEAAAACRLPPAALFPLVEAGIIPSYSTPAGPMIAVRDLISWARLWHSRLTPFCQER